MAALSFRKLNDLLTAQDPTIGGIGPAVQINPAMPSNFVFIPFQGQFLWVAWQITPTQAQIDAAIAVINSWDQSEYSVLDKIVHFSNGSDLILVVSRAVLFLIADQLNALREQIIGVATPSVPQQTLANGVSSAVLSVSVSSINPSPVGPGGPAFGDVVDVAPTFASIQGLTVSAWVDTAGDPGIIKVRLTNNTGASVTIAAGQWKVVVRRHSAMPDITVAAAKQALANKIQSGQAS